MMADHHGRAVLLVALAFTFAGGLWFAIHPPDASVSMDDGAYAIAVAQQEAGSWSIAYDAADADPGGAAFPYPNAERTGDRYFPYVRQPAWVVGLRAADAVAGPIGMRALLIAFGAATVVATGVLARVAGVPRAAPLAAGLVALSPLAFNALQLWGHVPSTLGVVLAALGGLLVLDRQQTAPGALLAVGGACLAGFIRADAALFALVVGGVIGLAGLRRRRWTGALAGVLVGGAAVAAQLATGLWAGSITGTAGAGRATDSRATGGAADRLDAALPTLFLHQEASRPAIVLTLLALAAAIAAAVLIRREDRRGGTMMLAVAAALWLIRTVVERDQLASGLLGAWPVAVLALVLPWSRRTPGERVLLAVVGVGTLAILATQYDIAGGAQWGGRFLSAGVPLLAVSVAGALRPAGTSGLDGPQKRLGFAVLLVAAATTVGSMGLDSHYRLQSNSRVDAVEDAAPEHWVVTSSRALPNLAWRTFPEVRWLRVPSEREGGAARLLVVLQKLGVRHVVAMRVEPADLEVLTDSAETVSPDLPTIVHVSRT